MRLTKVVMRAHKPNALAILRVELQTEVHSCHLLGWASLRRYFLLRLSLLEPPLWAVGLLSLRERPAALLCL